MSSHVFLCHSAYATLPMSLCLCHFAYDSQVELIEGRGKIVDAHTVDVSKVFSQQCLLV